MSRNLRDQLAANTPNAAAQAINTIVERAEKHFDNKENDEGFAILAEAQEHYPDQPRIAYLIGKYTAERKSTLDGIKKLEAVLEQHPDHLPTLLELGQIHLKPGNTRRATPYFHKALEIAPNNPSCYVHMGALHQRKGDFPLAVENYRKGIELQLKHPIDNKEPKKKKDFKIEEAEKLLWETLKLFADNGLHVFMAFGSLLGIERDGELLLHDKDVDVGLPHSEIDRAMQLLRHNGWAEHNSSSVYMSPRAAIHQKTGFTMDLFSFVIDAESKKALCLGAAVPNIPKEWNILWEFSQIELEKKVIPNDYIDAPVWYLKNPEIWLEEIYDDWRTPDKNFDTMVSAHNLRSFSPLAKCFTYSRLFEKWTENNIPRALSLARTALRYEPNDALMKRVLTRLESRRKYD